MSRIGKKMITVPKGVELTIRGSEVSVKGPKGTNTMQIVPQVELQHKDGAVSVTLKDNDRVHWPVWGMTRAKLAAMIEGVEKGFQKTIEISGVGFRVAAKGTDLEFSLGYSHPILFKVPKAVDAKVQGTTVVVLSSVDKELLGEVGAKIRKLRVPDVYQHKGVKYQGEHLRKKAGKAASTGKTGA